MERYLLFDSGCSACTGLAHAIERESHGWLTARSLRDAEMQALLKEARPEWRWEPTLLEVDGTRVRVFTGLKLRARIALGLGPKRAWRVAELAQQAEVRLTDVGQERRHLLRRFAVGAGLALFGSQLLPTGAKAQITQKKPIVWLTDEQDTAFAQEATHSQEVQILSAWLTAKIGWQQRSVQSYVVNSEDIQVYSVLLSGGATISSPTPARIYYLPEYGKAIAWLDGQGYFSVRDGQVQQVTKDMLPPNLPSNMLGNKSLYIPSERPSDPTLAGRCCSLYLACFAADAVCAALFAACLAGCIPCCPAGLGSCGAGVTACAAAAGCGPFDCFS